MGDHIQFEFMEISAIKAGINIPRIIKITCSNVKAVMKNNGYCKEIGLLTLPKEDIGKYIHKDIYALQNFELQEKDPQLIQIELMMNLIVH